MFSAQIADRDRDARRSANSQIEEHQKKKMSKRRRKKEAKSTDGKRESILPGERDRSRPRSPLSRFTVARASNPRAQRRE